MRTFQAEDEIAAITSAIGAAYGGALGVTTSSGPGIALKGEAMGLAVMLEIPLVIVNIQRGGPSTGLPTKTEQSDLMQAYYGRNGECPMPIVSASTPADCFDAVYEAVRIAVQHMTPVIFLSDGYIANGAEPWRFPQAADLPQMPVSFKQNITGNISYEPENHQLMVKIRQQKVDKIADYIPEQKLDSGPDKGKILVLGWGSTYGAIKSACAELQAKGHVRPFPKNLGDIIKNFDTVLIPEINNGQLIKIIRDVYFVDAKGYNKIMGVPITKTELVIKLEEMLNA